MTTYITRHYGIDDVVVGRISGDVVQSNDNDLTEALEKIKSLKTFKKVGSKKFASENQMLTNIKNRLCYPFGLTTEANVEFEVYQDTI